MKLCTKCRTEKELEDFYDQPSSQPTKDGKTYWCRACYARNYADNRERQKLSNRRASIRRRYGLTLEEYEALIARGCSICGEKEKRIVMDHCHATNAVRAPLCDGCNLALGAAGDSPALLRKMADYLESHRALDS